MTAQEKINELQKHLDYLRGVKNCDSSDLYRTITSDDLEEIEEEMWETYSEIQYIEHYYESDDEYDEI